MARNRAGTSRRTRRAKSPEEIARIEVRDKAVAIGVPAAQIDRGYHEMADVKLRSGERIETLRTLINRGGTAVDRWKRESQLTETQAKAIAHCEALWQRAATVRGLVADPLRIVGQPGGSGLSQQEALDELSKYKGRVPPRYWDVFENVCRWDEPAGVAGSSLATNARSALTSARTCVAFVADLIAMWRGL